MASIIQLESCCSNPTQELLLQSSGHPSLYAFHLEPKMESIQGGDHKIPQWGLDSLAGGLGGLGLKRLQNSRGNHTKASIDLRDPQNQDKALTVNSKECNCEERSRVIIVREVERQGTHHWGLQLQRVDCQLQQPSFVCVLILSLYVCSILYCMCI